MRLGRFKLVVRLFHLSPEGRGRASAASEGEGVRMLQNFLKLPNPLTPTLSPPGGFAQIKPFAQKGQRLPKKPNSYFAASVSPVDFVFFL
jgi:hypothetical protein